MVQGGGRGAGGHDKNSSASSISKCGGGDETWQQAKQAENKLRHRSNPAKNRKMASFPYKGENAAPRVLCMELFGTRVNLNKSSYQCALPALWPGLQHCPTPTGDSLTAGEECREKLRTLLVVLPKSSPRSSFPSGCAWLFSLDAGEYVGGWRERRRERERASSVTSVCW